MSTSEAPTITKTLRRTKAEAGSSTGSGRMTDIHAALENWARWAESRDAQGHCASIEFRYRNKLRPDMTPTGWGDWIPAVPPPILPQIDALKALEIERLMRHLPDDHRKALKLVYVLRMPREIVCLHLVIAFRDYDRYLGDAMNMIYNLLSRSRRRGKG